MEGILFILFVGIVLCLIGLRYMHKKGKKVRQKWSDFEMIGKSYSEIAAKLGKPVRKSKDINGNSYYEWHVFDFFTGSHANFSATFNSNDICIEQSSGDMFGSI